MAWSRNIIWRGSVLALSLILSLGGLAPEALSFAEPAPSSSQTMCMAAGERTSGMNKICYYDCLGSTRTVTQSAVSLCALSINAPAFAPMQTPRAPSSPRGGQMTCFARGEETSGMNKICYYDCLGSARAVTQSAVSLCPLTINQ